MNKIIYLSIICCLVSLSASAQKKKVLLTIDDQPVYAKEFKQVYLKNLNLVQEEEQKTVDGYLQMFIDYKLKVAEAYSQELDERKSYVDDFSKYQEQLSRNYIYENSLTEELAKEAYNRSLEEIDASHILIACNWDAVPQDTLVAYNKIKSIRAKAVAKGADFSQLAVKNSEEPNVEKSKGRLGYFTAFGMVFPFENAAYNTPVGEVSEIVRTQYGYHILKVHDRRKREAAISVAHIMTSTRGQEEGYNPKERIEEIATLLEQGLNFDDLARQYSVDKATAKKNGKMRKFVKGELRAPSFEEAAYALQNPGDISKPVKTDFGWHIIKLIEKHTMPSFEEERVMLERKVKDGERSKIVSTAVNNKIKDKYGYTSVNPYLPFFQTYVGDEVLKRKWEYKAISENENKVIFTIGETKATYNELAKYIEERQKKARPYTQKVTLLKAYYDEFETKVLKDHFKTQLELENDEYAGVIREYRDGLLIFEVMGDNVWNKAKQDTLGQEAFFNANKGNYNWKQRVDADVISTSDKAIMEQVKALLKEGKTAEEIKTELNKDKKAAIILSSKKFEIGQKGLPKDFEVKEGISKVYNENNTYTVVVTKEIIPAGPKEFDEVKGKVLSDYQNEVEKQWMESLRAKYEVEVNKRTLKRLRKELKA